MGSKNSHLITAAQAAKASGNSAKWERFCRLIEQSQEECPHPVDQRRTPSWAKHTDSVLCLWCSKRLPNPNAASAGELCGSKLAVQSRSASADDADRASKEVGYQPGIREEALELATDLDDEWQCSGGVKHWTDEEKRSFIKRAADLASLVKEILK